MILFLLTAFLAVSLAVLFVSRVGLKNGFHDLKNYIKYSYPAIGSNVGDVLYRSYDRVCE